VVDGSLPEEPRGEIEPLSGDWRLKAPEADSNILNSFICSNLRYCSGT
jgi:hypothetical protein